MVNAGVESGREHGKDGTTVMTTTKGYDFLNRLTNIVSSGTGFQPVSFAYAHNSANQRTAITNADDSKWIYTYDSLGQVISGKKYWSDGTPVAGQHFEYAFDDIGNRQSTQAGGDNSGANLRPASYLNNALNQIVSREVSSYVNVLGSAHSNATVTLWGDNGQYSPTSRKREYFRGELYAKNATGAVWLTITNVAVLNNGANPDMVTNVTGKVLLAKTPETFSYDADGNLTRDGLWTNTWNAENRLLKTESLASVPPAARSREEWTYLPDGRWIQRIVSTNNGASYYPAYTNRYVWDGQVLLVVLDHTNGLVMSFARGLDLSGSLQGAGGVGGVLAVNFKTNGTHFFWYDGNGNVTALVNAANGAESARYEYGPFAEPIRMTGPMAKLNPIRFSSQYADDVTGDVKYLYRDYDPSTGRWPSRDPIGERGGVNLYGFVENAPVNKTDLLGRETVGAAYQTDGALGHAALEVGGKGYGFGPKELRLFFTIGTTSNWEATAKPRKVWDLSIRKTGKFKDKRGGRCCDATLERVIQCADHFKATWEGTEWRLSRNCRHYVDTIISSCCLSRGAARHEQEEGGAQ